jgi:hypothetical protein
MTVQHPFRLWLARALGQHRRSPSRQGGRRAGLGLEPLEGRLVPAFVINPTFDSSITADPNAARLEGSINRVIAAYENTFTDNVTVNIKFQEVGGQTLYNVTPSAAYLLPYSTYWAALTSHATSADDSTALTSAPSTSPITGTADDGEIAVLSALANALGLGPGSSPSDATIGLNPSIMNLTRTGQQDPSKDDLMAATAGGIDTALGLYSGLTGLKQNDPVSTVHIYAADLFRYAAAGQHSFNTALSTQAYFSLDGGATPLARFNQDVTDLLNGWFSQGPHTPQVQDAVPTPGATPNLGVELRYLDVMGYTRAAPVTLNLTEPPHPPVAANQPAAFDLGSITNGNGPFQVTVNWGDGSANTTFVVDGTGSLGSQTHTYAAGEYTPTVSVTDFTSQTGSTSFPVAAGELPNVAVSGGSAVVTGTFGDDPITLVVNGSNYRSSDPYGLTAGAGATQVDANTVDVPIASVTGNVPVNTGAGNDTFTVDSSGGNIPSPIAYDGGSGTNPLVVKGTFQTGTETFTTAGPRATPARCSSATASTRPRPSATPTWRRRTRPAAPSAAWCSTCPPAPPRRCRTTARPATASRGSSVPPARASRRPPSPTPARR